MAGVDFYASQRHLVDHLLPLWDELEDVRGTFYCLGARRDHVEDYARSLGLDITADVPQWPGPPTIVASHPNLTNVYYERPIIYLEHGAGQTYADHPWHPSYSGGGSRPRVIQFLTLNDTTAARERAAYPNAQVGVVGSLRLDALTSRLATGSNSAQLHAGASHSTDARRSLPRLPAVSSDNDRQGKASRPPRPVVVACAWHWQCSVVPETKPAWEYWRHTFADLVHQGVTVLGHGHPRFYRDLVPMYERHGIEPVADFAEVLERADVLCFDNTSAGYEAAACGLPVVALNAPWYRRDVHHGLRFWDFVPGPQADTPDDLWPAIEQALEPHWAERRAEVSAVVYPAHTRGHAARLAASKVRVTLATTARV